MTATNDPLRTLILGYAPRERRAALAAVLALDDALGQVLRTTREPVVGQMRLAWWREALAQLDSAPPPGEPVLRTLAGDVLPLGISGATLAELVDGWEPLLIEPGERALAAHAELRGAALFAAAARLLAIADFDPADAGRGWALDDLADNLGDAALAAAAKARAAPLLDRAAQRRWPLRARALGALVHLARMRLAGPIRPAGVLRLGWHRLTGR